MYVLYRPPEGVAKSIFFLPANEVCIMVHHNSGHARYHSFNWIMFRVPLPAWFSLCCVPENLREAAHA